MRSPGGVFIATGVEDIKEYDTFTCGHCNAVKVVQHKQKAEDIGGVCKQCMKLVCDGCVRTGTCDPFEEKLKREEARYYARRSYES